MSPQDLVAAINAVPRCDALLLHLGGESYRYPAARIRRAVAAVRKRKGLRVSADKEGVHFCWDTGRLRLAPDTWVYRRFVEHGRAVFKLVNPGLPARPAHLSI